MSLQELLLLQPLQHGALIAYEPDDQQKCEECCKGWTRQAIQSSHTINRSSMLRMGIWGTVMLHNRDEEQPEPGCLRHVHG